MLKLRVTSGPGAEGEIEVSGDRFVIGREPGVDLVLDDEEVSREHAALRGLPDGRLALEDLGSRNGTFVNTHKLTGPVSLSGGEEIRIGITTFVVEPAGAAATKVAQVGQPTQVAEATTPIQSSPVKAESDRAPMPARIGTVLLALLLAFGAAVMIVVAIDINDLPLCNDPAAILAEQVSSGSLSINCFDSSETAQTVSMILAWAGGIVGGIAAVLALLFTIRGRGGRPLALATIAAVALSVLSIVVGSI